MKKKILSVLGAALLLASTTLSAQDYETSVGVNIGYRETKPFFKSFNLDSDTTETNKISKLKHIMLGVHADMLFNDAIYLGANIKYGVATKRASSHSTMVSPLNVPPEAFVKLKGKNKGHIFQPQFILGYKFKLSDKFSIMPVVGYEFYKLKIKYGSTNILFPTTSYHAPLVGLRLAFQPSDPFTLNAHVNYLFPKMKFAKDTRGDMAITGLDENRKGRGKGMWRFGARVGYKISDNLELDLNGEYNRSRFSRKFKDYRIKAKLRSWEGAFGLNIYF